jgi:environmental stress-induced protein Ves
VADFLARTALEVWVAQAGFGESVVRAASLVAVPWANGGGVTRVIADRPQFRLSLATIASEAPFSRLPGLIRHFALVTGRVDLTGPNACFPAVCDAMSSPLTFPGACPVHAVPRSGPALALNLMVPTDAPPLRLQRCDAGMLDDVVAVFACDAIVIDGMALEPHDTLFPDGPVHLSGRALVVR